MEYSTPRKETRLDLWLAKHGHARSRARAQALIKAGNVLVNGQLAAKAGQTINEGDVVTLAQPDHPYVSRAALKLKELLEKATPLGLSPAGRVAVDLGTSTGGFAQVLLEEGAAHLFGVEVGHDQLDATLAGHPRLTLWEKTDARSLSSDMFPQPPKLLTADLSFISLALVLDEVLPCLPTLADLCLLIKPQFELEPAAIARGGLVKKPEDHARAVNRVQKTVEKEGFRIMLSLPSPIPGGDGNREFLLWASKQVACPFP